MPYFIINFAGLLFQQANWTFEGDSMRYCSYLYPGYCPEGLNIESMHITSKKDGLFMFSNEYLYFDKPKLIYHDKGH